MERDLIVQTSFASRLSVREPNDLSIHFRKRSPSETKSARERGAHPRPPFRASDARATTWRLRAGNFTPMSQDGMARAKYMRTEGGPPEQKQDADAHQVSF